MLKGAQNKSLPRSTTAIQLTIEKLARLRPPHQLLHRILLLRPTRKPTSTKKAQENTAEAEAETEIEQRLAGTLPIPVGLHRYRFATRRRFIALPTTTFTRGGKRTDRRSTTSAMAATDENGQKSMMAARRAQEAKEQTATQTNRKGQFGGYFPLGYKEGFSQWWASVSPAAAEHKVMSFIPNLKSPPTQTQTGRLPVPEDGSEAPLQDGPDTQGLASQTESNSDPHGQREWRSNLVALSGKNRALNEFSVERIGEPVEQNLVMLHGYGAGLGFFYKNFEALSQAKGWKVYALDMLGMGRSSRPSFRIKAKEREASITEAESWFVDALEEWRVQRKIERFTLLGHSLGGYMAVAYALKYPGHLNKLILASPVGIPEDPYAVNAAMPEPQDSTMQNEFTQDQDSTTTTTTAADNNNFLNARSKAEKAAAASNNTSRSSSPSTATIKDTKHPQAPVRRPYPKWLVYLWDANISPFSLVRWAGPLGPRFVSGWTSRRFSHLPADEKEALHTYAYTLFKQRGSGEYALAYILAPGAFARSPLIRRIGGVGRQTISPLGVASGMNEEKGALKGNSVPTSTSATTTTTSETPTTPSSSTLSSTSSPRKETGVPVVLMYGENDWMDVKGGHAATKSLLAAKTDALQSTSLTEEERKRENGDAKVVIISKAGHHVYLDNFEEFNRVMLGEMRDVERREGRLRALAREEGIGR
ncbi:hypothetical protein MMC25_005748 [Agyrium rufum]|nr:hypothetical protein [Agyrium rufum]